jgi:tRNA G18 (ribose-2'-O)-methylase SpoU
VYLADTAITKALTGFGVVLDIVALFHRPPARPPAQVIGRARRMLVFEQIDNPANVGAIVRSAAALGFDGFLVDPTSADPLARRAARASMGTVFSLPWSRCPALPEGLAPLRDAGFRLLALTPATTARDLASLAVAPDERIALLLGSERDGLSVEALSVSEPVRIPMTSGVDSLNVAAAAAIACYELGG